MAFQALLINLNSLYGANEELLGRWFKKTGKRDEIFLATKFGYVKGSKTLEVDTSASYCKAACAESLRLLGIDYIDLCKSLEQIVV
jgi:aryl-alcohol dehydrogenase-like predicted oxidoreductase